MAGSIPYNFAQQFSAGGVPANAALSGTVQNVVIHADTYAASLTNTQVAISFAHAKVVFYNIVCDQALTIDFNSSGSPAPQVVLVANEPVTFFGVGTSLFAADVTTMFITTGAIPASAHLVIQVGLSS